MVAGIDPHGPRVLDSHPGWALPTPIDRFGPDASPLWEPKQDGRPTIDAALRTTVANERSAVAPGGTADRSSSPEWPHLKSSATRYSATLSTCRTQGQ